MKKGPEKDENQKKAGLHQFNAIAEQMIAYLTENPKVLEAEGFMRLTGKIGEINKAYSKVEKDPSQFTAALKAFSNPDDKAGLFKRALKEVSENWTVPAQEALAEVMDGTTDTYQTAVTKLIQKGEIEEAKALHNILHISRLITTKQNQNKMGNQNVAVVLGNYFLANQNADPVEMLKALPAVHEKFITSMTETFDKPFDASYPELNTQLEASGSEKSEPTSPTSSAPASFKVGEPQNVKHVAGSGITTQSEQQGPSTGVVKARVAEFEKMGQRPAVPPVSSTPTTTSSATSVAEESQPRSKWRERVTALIDTTRTLLAKVQGVLATGIGAAADFIGKNAARFGKFASEQWIKRPAWLGGKPSIKGSEEPIIPSVEKSAPASFTPPAAAPVETPKRDVSAEFEETFNSFLRGGKAASQGGAPVSTPPSPQAQERKDKWIDNKISQLSDVNPNQGFYKLVMVAHESLFSKYLLKDTEAREVFEILRGAIREDGTRHLGHGIDVDKIKTEYQNPQSKEMKKLLSLIKDEGKRAAINKFIGAVVEAESTANFGRFGSPQDQKKAQKKALGQVYDAIQEVEKALSGEDKRPKPFAPQNGHAASSVTRTGSAQEKVADPGSPHHRSKKNP